MTRVLAGTGALTKVLAYSDEVIIDDLKAPVSTARGSRMKYIGGVWLGSQAATHSIYDFAGMARAHGRLALVRRPYLLFIHGIEVWRGWAQPKYLRAARRAAVLVANSYYTKSRANSDFGKFENVKVCWLATETDEPAPPRVSENGPPTVLMLGRIQRDSYKGHREVLAAWPKVVAAIPDARLMIVGGGDGVQEVREQAQGLKNACVLGFVPEAMMNEVWKGTTVLAMPSRVEGFGLVYIEAMRHGVPVVASIHDAAQEINVDNVTGYNVNLDKASELPERLIRLLGDPTHAMAMGADGRARWAKHFRYSEFRKRFLKIVADWVELSIRM